MKKLFAVMMAAATIAMVGCKKDNNSSPEIAKTTPDVEATEGFFTIVWNAYGYSDCEPLVFAGNYNDYTTSDPEALIKFEKIEGYENWYVARIDASLLPDKDGNTSCQGKGCALYNGKFNASWNHQWFLNEETNQDVVMVQGDGELIPDVGEHELKLVIETPGKVSYVQSFGFKQDPCEPLEYYDVTFKLHVENAVPAEAVVNIIGDFDDHSWDAPGVQFLEMERNGDNDFSITLSCPLNTEYKYAINAAANVEAGEKAFKQEMIKLAPEEGAECLPKNDNLKVVDVEMSTTIWGFVGVNSELPWCEEKPVDPVDVEVHPGEVLNIKVVVDPALNLKEGLFIWSWGHANDAGLIAMTSKGEGVWEASFTVGDETDVAGWKSSGMLFVDVDVTGEGGWEAKGGQTSNIEPIRGGEFHIDANWGWTEVKDEPAEEGGEEEGGEEEGGEEGGDQE